MARRFRSHPVRGKGRLPPVYDSSHEHSLQPLGGRRAKSGGVMSRELPRRPSLDHLKKQAKALLRELRLRQPETALTDAQHALAKDYGFDSWPQLKRHVEL